MVAAGGSAGMGDWSGLDLAVVLGYLLLVVAVGLWVGRGERTAEDYFLAGRSLPWYLIGLSFYASNMSGASFVGLIGASYAEGLVVFNYEWTAAVALIALAVFMLPVFLRSRIATLPEYLERRFDRRSRLAYSLFTLATLLFIDMAGAVYAGGLVIATLFPALDLWLASALLALLAGLYTLVGGLRSVVVTDAMQAVLIVVGAAAILLVGLREAGGWDAVLAGLAADKTSLLRAADDAFLPWPGLFGVLLLGFYYWTMNQYFVQRALAARTLDDARKGALFGGLLKLPNLFLMVMPGMVALALYPGLENPDAAFPTLAFELLPVGLRGLVLTALIAAIMSSLDSAINAAASLVTLDLVRSLRPRASGETLLWIGRLCSGLLIAIAALYAPLILRFGSLFAYFQSTLAYLVPPVVAVYLAGLLLPKLPAAAGFPALAGGILSGVLLFLAAELGGLWSAAGLEAPHFTLVALLLFLWTGLLLAIGRLVAGPAPTPALTSLRRSDLTLGSGRGPWYRDYRWQAAGLAAATLLFVAGAW